MANRTIGVEGELYDYLLRVGLREPLPLQQLREATEREEMSEMRSAPEQGQFMAMLLRLIGAKRVIEVGTYTGYATLWMALSLPLDGEIVTCDISERWTFVAHRFWEEAGVSHKVRLELGPALKSLDGLLARGEAESFDFAFIDADKVNYDGYYERCLQLVKPGGVIAVDNVLWGGSVVDAKNREESTRAIRALNDKLRDDERIDLAMLPLADGLTLAVKRSAV
ncbi:MAG TPA: class I SAM-dependent methyltransferase [Mariprofundaceae bacterium]|nr:class I SAM-dependent methyltransferase [Mariprofundaceae bacterium]